jgi:dual-specificity kinase
MCVYDFLKENDFAPFPRNHIQKFARQLLGSVACKLDVSNLQHHRLTSCLVLHELKLIHTDLKPENILLVRNDYRVVHVPVPGKVVMSLPCVLNISSDDLIQRNAPPKAKRILESTDIRLIDFGSATFEEEYHSAVVSTRHYRAPEIILGNYQTGAAKLSAHQRS